MPQKQPNILFIQTDQLLAQALRIYGDPVCLTPNLDKLARDGAVFETAYCNFPLCGPSRYSMASGQLASRIGAYDNAAEFSSFIPTYAHFLRDAGYQTCLSGKMHFVGPDQLHGFEERLTPDIYPADFTWTPNWEDTSGADANDDRALSISGPCARTAQIDYDNEACFKAERKLYDIARSSDERPFFLQVSFTHPHDPYLCLQEHWDRYEGVDIPMPEIASLPRDAHDPHSVRLLELVGMLDKPYPEEWTLRARRAYYGSVSYIDDRVGDLLQALNTADLVDNTVIIFTSDHGEMFGERGMWFKRTFFEQSLRIPLIIHAPGRIKPQRVETLASLVDLVPTFMGFAAGPNWVPPVDALDGADLGMFLGVKTQDRSIYAEYLSDMVTSPQMMIRRGSLKFITGSGDPDLLFDLRADPKELNNVATDETYSDQLQAFRMEVLKTWDRDQMTKDILLSQRRRKFVHGALSKGKRTAWEFEEKAGDDNGWYRGRTSYNDWAFEHLPSRS